MKITGSGWRNRGVELSDSNIDLESGSCLGCREYGCVQAVRAHTNHGRYGRGNVRQSQGRGDLKSPNKQTLSWGCHVQLGREVSMVLLAVTPVRMHTKNQA